MERQISLILVEISKSIKLKKLKNRNLRKFHYQTIFQQNSLRNCLQQSLLNFNKCLNKGTVPESFKISELVPIYRR